MKLDFERRRRCRAPRSANFSAIVCIQGAAKQLPCLRFQVLFESLLPDVLLLDSPIRFFRDPVPYSAEALMIHEVCNKGFTKPILNLFRMYARIGTQQVAFHSSGAKDPLAYADLWGTGETPDISGFAALSGSHSLEVLIYNHHDDWDRSDDYEIELEIANLPVDGDELNALVEEKLGQGWERMIRETSRHGGEQTLIFSRAEGSRMGLFIVDAENHEMDIVEVSVDPDHLKDSIHQYGHHHWNDDEKSDKDANDTDNDEE